MKQHLACSLVAAGISLLTLAGYAQTPIESLPFIVTKPGKYFFTKDLTVGNSNVGIAILDVSDVTIDLNGFYLRSPGPYNDQNGIVASNADNVVIQNGNFGRFQLGAVALDHCHGCLLQNLNVTDFRYLGIDLNVCTDSIVTNCEVRRATAVQNDYDQTGIKLTGGSGNLVVNTRVSGILTKAGINGIKSTGTNYFQGDYLSNCMTGISMSATDKYRVITTSNCLTATITGGIDVDNKSN
jgi:hypothetical protein